MLVLVSGVAAVIMPFARRSVPSEVDEDEQAWFYCMYLLCLTGLLGITVTGDAFNIFVFLEISSLSTYVLIALGSDRRALLAAYQYLIMGTIGATFYVIGVGLLYLVTGSLNMVDIAARLGRRLAENRRPVLAALAFLTVGICLKLALFPLHVWLPNAYAYAPSCGDGLPGGHRDQGCRSTCCCASSFRCSASRSTSRRCPSSEVMLALSVAAIFIASLIAVFRDRTSSECSPIRRSRQIGYITLGIGLANQAGLTGGIVHLVQPCGDEGRRCSWRSAPSSIGSAP